MVQFLLQRSDGVLFIVEGTASFDVSGLAPGGTYDVFLLGDPAADPLVLTLIPTNIISPSTSGIGEVGQTLTGTQGTWEGTPTPTITNRWDRLGDIWEAIPGETSLTYLLDADDGSTSVRFVDIATSSAGQEEAYSAEIEVSPTPGEVAILGALTNKTYDVSSGFRFYNVSSVTTGTPPITFFMLPKVIEVSIVDLTGGIYGFYAKVAGTPVPVVTQAWELDGTPVGGQTGATINAAALTLEGDLTVVVTATNARGNNSLESAAEAIDYNAATLVTPVHLNSTETYRAASTTHAVNHGAFSTGDLVALPIAFDSGPNIGGILTITAPNAETIVTEIARFGQNGTGGTSLELRYFIATAPQGADDLITMTLSASDQLACHPAVFDAGTFNASDPFSNAATGTVAASAGGTLPALVATNEAGSVFRAIAADLVNITSTPAGHTMREDNTGGAVNLRTYTRDAATTAAESVASQAVTLSGTDDYAAFSVVINPAST
jgi:hypothetical protein